MTLQSAPSLAEHEDLAWNKLTIEQRTRAIEILQEAYGPNFFTGVAVLVARHGRGEWSPPGWHHFQGMDVRNALREGGFIDEMLPGLPEIYGRSISNWDDFYIAAVEAAAGVRPLAHANDAPVYAEVPQPVAAPSLIQRLKARLGR